MRSVKIGIMTRSSSTEVRKRVPDLFSVVYFSGGTLPRKMVREGHHWGPSTVDPILRVDQKRTLPLGSMLASFTSRDMGVL